MRTLLRTGGESQSIAFGKEGPTRPTWAPRCQVGECPVPAGEVQATASRTRDAVADRRAPAGIRMHTRQGHTPAPTVCASRGRLPGWVPDSRRPRAPPARGTTQSPRPTARRLLRLFVMLIPFPAGASCLHNGRPEPRQPSPVPGSPRVGAGRTLRPVWKGRVRPDESYAASSTSPHSGETAPPRPAGRALILSSRPGCLPSRCQG